MVWFRSIGALGILGASILQISCGSSSSHKRVKDRSHSPIFEEEDKGELESSSTTIAQNHLVNIEFETPAYIEQDTVVAYIIGEPTRLKAFKLNNGIFGISGAPPGRYQLMITGRSDSITGVSNRGTRIDIDTRGWFGNVNLGMIELPEMGGVRGALSLGDTPPNQVKISIPGTSFGDINPDGNGVFKFPFLPEGEHTFRIQIIDSNLNIQGESFSTILVEPGVEIFHSWDIPTILEEEPVQSTPIYYRLVINEIAGDAEQLRLFNLRFKWGGFWQENSVISEQLEVEAGAKLQIGDVPCLVRGSSNDTRGYSKPSNVFNLATSWFSELGSYNTFGIMRDDVFLEFRFDRTVNIEGFKLSSLSHEQSPLSYHLETSTDGVSWSIVPGSEHNEKATSHVSVTW